MKSRPSSDPWKPPAPIERATRVDIRPAPSSRRLPFVATRAVTGVECQQCPMRASSLLKRAQLEDLHALHTDTVRRAHGAGDVVWRETDVGSGVVCLASGHALARVVTPGGDVALARMVGVGWAAGLAELLAKPRRSVRIDAISQVDACFLPAERLLPILKGNAHVAHGAAEKLAEQQNATLGCAYSQRVRTADARLMAAVLVLREAFGVTLADGTVRVGLPLSRRDLADLALMTPETLSRSIAVLEARHIARFRKREVTILDVEQAMDLAEPSV